MLRHGWPLTLLVVFALAVTSARAEPRATLAPAAKPTPLQDDAQLHDVHFAGARFGWAVGDHGVIWHTRDSGATWQLQPSGMTCPLKSVCFLTDRVGWVAGGGMIPYTNVSYGVLLATKDGGQTWTVLHGPPSTSRQPDETLERGKDARTSPDKASAERSRAASGTGIPRIHRIKFFSPEEGIAVCDSGSNHPTGVLTTSDGGKNWQDVPGELSGDWLAADFLSPNTGAIAGLRGAIGRVVEERVVSSRLEHLGLRGVSDIALQAKAPGWLVGDAGLLLQTQNLGLVWQAPARELPEGARDVFDFRAVACRGEKVWIAGNPGSVIWHSPDAGKTWHKQPTGQTVPLTAIHFSSNTHGTAVGSLGAILQTEDGGRTWTPRHGAGRRAALMTFHPRADRFSFNLLAEQSGEWGYRSLALVLARPDAPNVSDSSHHFPARLQEAVVTAGGSAGLCHWRFPLAVPGLDRDTERLIADWNRRTEHRLEEILTGQLVLTLRTWRPNVLVLEQAPVNDALGRLLYQASLKAVEQAADATLFIEQQDLAGLEPWGVDKVFVHLPSGSNGQVNVDPHQYLPRQDQTVQLVAASAEGFVSAEPPTRPTRSAYRLVLSKDADEKSPSTAGGPFAGLAIGPGSDARRELLPVDDDALAAKLKLAARQRNFSAYTEKYLSDPRHAGQLIAQLPEITRGVPDEQAAVQLGQLGEEYLATGQWELAELAFVELAEKYPSQPAAWKAMQWLVQVWGSGEATWRRLKKSSSEQGRQQVDPLAASRALEQALAKLARQAEEAQADIFNPASPERPGESEIQPAGYQTDAKQYRKRLDEKYRYWQSHALRMAQRLERHAPSLAGEPAIQFPLASLYRQRGTFQKSDEVYRKFISTERSSLWGRPALAEMWLVGPPRPATIPAAECHATGARPVLDGVLSDGCWQEAMELPLKASSEEGERTTSPGLAMLCYDAEFLYVAASLPRAPGTKTDGPVRRKRERDEDLSDFDRVSILLDTDRDYVTYFNLTVDQRGCTRDACWQDPSWNPRWFVAVDADEFHWRIEAAIPLEELGPVAPGKGAAWNVGILRTIPAVAVQSWTAPASGEPRPESFGIVRFD